jgi:hypothetical protein
MFSVFKELSCEAAGHKTVLTLTRERYWLKAGTVGWKLSDESISTYALQSSAQFRELLQRANKGEVQDLTSLDSLLGKRMCDLLEALSGTIHDWSFFLQQNVLKGFEYGDENCRGQIHLEYLAHYFLPLISFFFEWDVRSRLEKCSKLLTKNYIIIISWF